MKFFKKLLFILPLALSLSFCTQALGQSRWQGKCDITFTGKSSLHGFTGTVATEPFFASVTNPGNPTKMEVVSSARVIASKMNTKNKKRDARMHESLEIASYPEITVSVDIPAGSNALLKPVLENGANRPTEIPFTMILKGKAQNLVGKVTSWKFDGSVARFSVAFPISLKASGIKVPSVLGMIRVKDRIDVTADVTLVAQGSSASSR